jgi:hypothetical protein
VQYASRTACARQLDYALAAAEVIGRARREWFDDDQMTTN